MQESKEEKVISLLLRGIRALKLAGADFALMASNTPHMYFQQLQERSSIPLLNIVEETAKETQRRGFGKVGLLGTQFTMEGKFYKSDFEGRDIKLVTPNLKGRKLIDEKIFDEFTSGDIREETKENLIKIVEKMVKEEGIEAVILGCTELPLLLNQEVLPVPVLNTTSIHARAALDYAARK